MIIKKKKGKKYESNKRNIYSNCGFMYNHNYNRTCTL